MNIILRSLTFILITIGLFGCSGYKKAVRLEQQRQTSKTALPQQKTAKTSTNPSPKTFKQKSVPLMAADTSNANSLLWEISGKDLTTSSYLYGTIHVIPKKDFILTDLLKNRFAQTQQLALEVDMDNMLSMISALPEMFMDDDMTLEDLLTEEEYNRVDAHFANKGMGGLSMFNRMKPILVSSMMMEQGPTSEDMTSYEMELMDMAKDRQMAVHGLETAAFQMGVLDSIPYKAQAKMLVQSLDEQADGGAMYDEMVELYKNQDLKGLQAAVAAESEGVENFDHALLYIRNHNWIPVIAEMAKEKPTFFAVGAAHLPGEEGVIRLLQKAGYRVVPLREVSE